MFDLHALVDDTILGAIFEDLGIEREDPRYNMALQYLIDELQKEKSV